MKLILRLSVQRGEGTDVRKRHKFPRGEREMLKEIKIILVLVIKKVECWKNKKKIARTNMLYPKIEGREEEILQTLRTWKPLGGKLYVPREI